MSKFVLLNAMIQVIAIYYSLANTIDMPQPERADSPPLTSESTTTDELQQSHEAEKPLVMSEPAKKKDQAEIWERMKEMVGMYCPRVDICAANATNAELEPNGVVRRRAVSCCKGCSCHPDCKVRKNCCFPDEFEAAEDKTDEFEAGEDKTDELGADEDKQPGYECLYARIGRDEQLDATVPAFRTVVTPPKDGCVDATPFKVAPNIVLTPTCEDIDVTPLGSYFPVYSEKTGEIYKNILCARCHGVKRTVPFSPILGCEDTIKKTGSHILPISEILSFLESKTLTTWCHVDFELADKSILDGKRCYKTVISTCQAGAITVRYEQKWSNLDFDTIKGLCESGFNSPTVQVQTGLVYKNVFCSLCGQAQSVPFLCAGENDNGKTTNAPLSYFIDPKIMHTIGKNPGQTKEYKACLTKQKNKNQEECKRIHCPTGKIRSESGACVLVGNILNSDGFLVSIKLTPRLGNDFDEIAKKTNNSLMVQSVLKGNPWPGDWKVVGIFFRIDDTVCAERAVVIVDMLSAGKDMKATIDDVKKSLKLPWILGENNTTISFSQSFQEYKRKSNPSSFSVFKPSWQAIHPGPNISENYFSCGPIEWKKLFLVNFLKQPGLNKLYLCDQIQLHEEEIVLGLGQFYLTSNLTKRILHDLEFDLIEDTEGRIQARVCLVDTIFLVNKPNGGNMLRSLGAAIFASMAISLLFLQNYVTTA